MTLNDIYKIAGSIAGILRAVEAIGESAARQLETISDQLQLGDDQGVDPIVRISTAIESTYRMNSQLHSAIPEAIRCWVAIGHLRVIPSVQPNHRTATTGELGATFDAP